MNQKPPSTSSPTCQPAPFFNLLAASAYVIRESGPFTESNLSSRTLTGAVDFRVGEPWGKTALVTGWGDTDQTFSPDVAAGNHFCPFF